MTNCTSCGESIPDGQGRSCSMCYGDIGYGKDGYYCEWAEEQEREYYRQQAEEREQHETE